MARRLAPSVNAGSMADIAFLLLIFFLVTTTIQTDYGISRKLPPPLEGPVEAEIKKKNLFKVELNKENELLVGGVLTKIGDLKRKAVAFLDNGGSTVNSCMYCKGMHDSKSSDHPKKAVISVVNSRETNYGTYIAVQNELLAAYTDLRNREANRLYGVSFESLKKDFGDSSNYEQKQALKEKIEHIKSLFPEKISEAEPKN
ncbi:ExbD/TolR family protein [Aquimarina pacifica]|uniref:ExbD/TolR family protein n=1 Tax=Aquimarina pacifica TaxID=1296415 RepID=UPI00046F9BA7|nr:biopolymer transporter ExbD [Aquimarina pacifica]